MSDSVFPPGAIDLHPVCLLPSPDRPAAIWLAVWPSAADGFTDPRDAGLAIAEAARLLARDTTVAVVARPGDLADASMRCGAGVRVSSWGGSLRCFADRLPMVGHGPDGRPLALDWTPPSDAAGGVAIDHDPDCDITARLLGLGGHGEVAAAMRALAPVAGRAQMIAGDGHGMVVASEALLATADPDARAAVADLLCRSLDAERVIWVPGGFSEDDWPGSLDGVVRFLAPGVVAVATAIDGDPDQPALHETRLRLEVTSQPDGRLLTVVPVPLPRKRPRSEDGRLLPASYLSLLRDGRRLVVPAFDDGNDDVALRLLSRALPAAAIEQVSCRALAGYGGLARLAVALPQAPALDAATIAAAMTASGGPVPQPGA